VSRRGGSVISRQRSAKEKPLGSLLIADGWKLTRGNGQLTTDN